jgi:hypothetical protein
MKTNKLFQALVVTGALMGANAMANSPSSAETERLLASLEAGSALEKTRVFCNSKDPEVCVSIGCGLGKPKPGLECCWGTSCNDFAK